MRSVAPLDREGLALRAAILRQTQDSGRGVHIGPAFSILELVRAVYDVAQGLTPGAADPARDRVILSKGHGCLALYAVLEARGFLEPGDLAKFGGLGARLGGHPEREVTAGIEATTGALGHGLPLAVGMALAARIQRQPSRVYVITGDGELNEGAVWEAALHATKHRLNNLVVAVDHNGQQCNGATEDVLPMGDLVEKWRAFGFQATALDGHSMPALRAALEASGGADCPTALICHTIKNRGVPGREGDLAWHYRAEITRKEVDEILGHLQPAGVA